MCMACHDRPKKGIRHSYATNGVRQRESNIDRKQYPLLNSSMQNASCSFLGMEEPSYTDHLRLHHVSHATAILTSPSIC